MVDNPRVIQQETRDNQGRPDENKRQVFVFGGPLSESLNIEEGPTQLKKRNAGDAFIIGHSVNGVLGTANGTGGTQITLGDGKIGATTINRVTNPGNVFHEHFRYSNFNDSTVTTANFDTTNFNVAFDVNEIFQTPSIFLNQQSIISVQLDASINGGSTTFNLSSDEEGQDVTVTEGVNA